MSTVVLGSVFWGAGLAAGCTEAASLASGDVGIVRVFGQRDEGPVPLVPGRRNVLPRPQELAFELVAAGTGTRDVRIEVSWLDGRRQVVHEERAPATGTPRYLDFLLKLDESLPDRLRLYTIVEPPHDLNLTVAYDIVLVGTRYELRKDSPAR
ncbi:MAG: hypothetical protein HC923_08215 [Myxococcales bacterium]|nr:hypothetical protein [Myxococcales bacterium]